MIDLQTHETSSAERRQSDRRTRGSDPSTRDPSSFGESADVDRRSHSRRTADTLERIRALELSIAAAGSPAERQMLAEIIANYRAWHDRTRGL
jgi:hypothetical protein